MNENKKTVFTILSENLYEDMKSGREINISSFINENFLSNYIEKLNSKNGKIIRSFVERKDKEILQKKIKIYKDENSKIQKVKKGTKKNEENFIKKQKEFIENKKNHINEIKTRVNTEIEKTIRNKPIINSKSIDFFSSSKKSILFSSEAKAHPKQKNKTKEAQRKVRKIKENPLAASYKTNKVSLVKKGSENSTNYNTNNTSIVIINNKNNALIFRKFLKNLSVVLENLYKITDMTTNPLISFEQFKEILSALSLAKTETNDISSAWETLLKQSKPEAKDENKIYLFTLIQFFLCILDLIKMRSKLSYINSDFYLSDSVCETLHSNYRHFNLNYLFNTFKQKPEYKSETQTLAWTSKPHSHSRSHSKRIQESSLIKLYSVYKTKREKKLTLLRNKQQQEELKECTFYPNNFSPTRDVSTEVTHRLYTSKPASRTVNSVKEEYSFAPSLTTYNKKMFLINPIQDDPSVNTKIEQYEQARADKKLNEYLKRQGSHSISKIKSFEEIVNEIVGVNPKNNMRFDCEFDGYKDTFDKFKKKNHIYEIKIGDVTKRIIIPNEENASKIVEKFCKENSLDAKMKEQILSVVKGGINK